MRYCVSVLTAGTWRCEPAGLVCLGARGFSKAVDFLFAPTFFLDIVLSLALVLGRGIVDVGVTKGWIDGIDGS
jgi:hypothetical protein